METIKEFWDALINLIQEFFAPMGGLAFIVYVIANFFAARIAAKELQELKSKHAKELEELKAEHSKEIDLYRNQLEVAKAGITRYTEQQFMSYNDLWSSLYELKMKGNQLWERANNSNLWAFTKQLIATREIVEKNSLFIEDMHYQTLQQLLVSFSEYELNKKRLIELRGQDRVDTGEIQTLIDHNGETLNRYRILIEDIRVGFRQQLNIKFADNP